MTSDEFYDLPSQDPVTGGSLYVSEVTGVESGVTIRGRFRVPQTAMLDKEHQEFLEVFLRSRGVISTVEKEMGISYPTVRARLDSLLKELDLKPIKNGKAKAKKKATEARRKILERLEAGEISAEEAKDLIKTEVGQ